MDKEKALQIIKQAIDAGVASGVFKNTESVMTIGQALQIIIQELSKSQEK